MLEKYTAHLHHYELHIFIVYHVNMLTIEYVILSYFIIYALHFIQVNVRYIYS